MLPRPWRRILMPASVSIRRTVCLPSCQSCPIAARVAPDLYAAIICCKSSSGNGVTAVPIGVTTGPRLSLRGTDTLESYKSSPSEDPREINDFKAANEVTVSSRLGHVILVQTRLLGSLSGLRLLCFRVISPVPMVFSCLNAPVWYGVPTSLVVPEAGL